MKIALKINNMNGNFLHDVAYLITGVIIWPICYVSGFIFGLFKVIFGNND